MAEFMERRFHLIRGQQGGLTLVAAEYSGDSQSQAFC
jgi:hypothetical protein